MEPTVIYESSELLVLDKPAGLIVHRDGRTIESSLCEWIANVRPAMAGVGEVWISPQGEHVPLCGVVHRLDRTTSGVIVAAKTNPMYEYLKLQFKDKKVEKLYRAFVYGVIEEERGEIVAEIMRTSTVPKKWYARPTHRDDRRAAITQWRVFEHCIDPETGEVAAYAELRPLTGRTHQLRVHMESIGHPIVADHLYAGEYYPILGFNRPALHAYSISLNLHQESRTFTAQLPMDFTHALLHTDRSSRHSSSNQ